jgi:hypothetical protein
MVSLMLGRLASYRILAGMLIGAALAVAGFAQASRQLHVEVGPDQEVKAVASEVSYGEVLRALQKKLGWEMEIPPVANELRVSYIRLETKQPEDALAKLLEGSGLDYFCVRGVNGSRSLKVLVIPPAHRETEAPQDAAPVPPMPENSAVGASLPVPVQMQTVTAILPTSATAVEESAPEPPMAPSMMPLSEATNSIGAPSGVSASDAGKSMTVPVSDAARIMGAPAGVAPGDVGKTVTLPLPTGSAKRP